MKNKYFLSPHFLVPNFSHNDTVLNLESLYFGFGSPFGPCSMKTWVPTGSLFLDSRYPVLVTVVLPFSLKIWFQSDQFSDNWIIFLKWRLVSGYRPSQVLRPTSIRSQVGNLSSTAPSSGGTPSQLAREILLRHKIVKGLRAPLLLLQRILLNLLVSTLIFELL